MTMATKIVVLLAVFGGVLVAYANREEKQGPPAAEEGQAISDPTDHKRDAPPKAKSDAELASTEAFRICFDFVKQVVGGIGERPALLAVPEDVALACARYWFMDENKVEEPFASYVFARPWCTKRPNGTVCAEYRRACADHGSQCMAALQRIPNHPSPIPGETECRGANLELLNKLRRQVNKAGTDFVENPSEETRRRSMAIAKQARAQVGKLPLACQGKLDGRPLLGRQGPSCTAYNRCVGRYQSCIVTCQRGPRCKHCKECPPPKGCLYR